MTEELKCDSCGKKFMSFRVDERFCSPTCRKVWHRKLTGIGSKIYPAFLAYLEHGDAQKLAKSIERAMELADLFPLEWRKKNVVFRAARILKTKGKGASYEKALEAGARLGMDVTAIDAVVTETTSA